MSTISRRTLLRSAAALLVTTSTAALPLAAASRTIPTCGCWLCARDAAALALKPYGLIASDPQEVRIITSTGDATIDKFLGSALLRLSNMFKVQPGFAFFDDGDSPSAYATPETLLPQGTHTVMMGTHLFSEYMTRNDDAGMTIIAICAHEFGHIHQMEGGYRESLLKHDTTVRPIELHADFLAGFFLASRKREYPNLELQKVGETFYRLGDTAFKDRGHHGTPQERIAAITAGYELGRNGNEDIDQVAQAGIDYVLRNL